MSEVVKIFSQLYVGFNRRTENEDWKEKEEIYLGFATPVETGKAGEKKRETVDRWAMKPTRFASGQYYGKPDEEKVPNPHYRAPETIDNKEMAGFRITRQVRHWGYRGSGMTMFRIEDPRGFELEISPENLAKIIDCVGIQKEGVVPVPCIWGRSGGANVLIPQGSEHYKVAFTAAENIPRVAAKELIPGSKVMLDTGAECYFMGRYHFLEFIGEDITRKVNGDVDYYKRQTQTKHYELTFGKNSLKTLLKGLYQEPNQESLTVQASPKISKVLEEPETPYELDRTTVKSGWRNSYSYICKKKPKISLELVRLSCDEAKAYIEKIKEAGYGRSEVLVVDSVGGGNVFHRQLPGLVNQATYTFGDGCLNIIAKPRSADYNYSTRMRDENNLTLNLKYLEENLDSLSLLVAKVQDEGKTVSLPVETYLN